MTLHRCHYCGQDHRLDALEHCAEAERVMRAKLLGRRAAETGSARNARRLETKYARRARRPTR